MFLKLAIYSMDTSQSLWSLEIKCWPKMSVCFISVFKLLFQLVTVIYYIYHVYKTKCTNHPIKDIKIYLTKTGQISKVNVSLISVAYQAYKTMWAFQSLGVCCRCLLSLLLFVHPCQQLKCLGQMLPNLTRMFLTFGLPVVTCSKAVSRD